MTTQIIASVIIVGLTLLAAPSTYVISGLVQDDTGKPADCVRVCAHPEDFDPKKPGVNIPCALSDSRGQFTITVNKASKYKLFYDHSDNGRISPYLLFFRHPSLPIPEVLLNDENVHAWITISMLPKNGRLIGKSVDTKTGLPVQNVEFILCHAANTKICWPISAKSADGNFNIPTPHVPFILTAKANGFDDWLGAPISVAPETQLELSVFLNRSEASSDKAMSESEKVVGVHLPAPAQLMPADETVFDHYPRLTKLEWSTVEGAVSYSVEVDYCAGPTKNKPVCVNPQPLRIKTNSPSSGILNTSYEFTFVGAQPGRWRVWALDKEGREGFKSPWRRFVYLK